MADSSVLHDRSTPCWAQVLIVVLVAAVAGFSVPAGCKLRRLTFDLFDAVHFENDIRRGCKWGLLSSGPEGFYNQYDKMAPQAEHWQEWGDWMDYAPLRLLVMNRWAIWVRRTYPEAVEQNHPNRVYAAVVPYSDRGSGRPDHLLRSYEFHRPLLLFNTAMDLLGAGAAFALTWLWVRRSMALRGAVHTATGLLPALFAGLLVWLNPTILIDAYAWPTWDAWVVPFYLLVALAMSIRRWFLAGVLLGIGALLKGQMLAISPALAAWAVTAGGPIGLLRMAAGTALAIGAIVAPGTMSLIDLHTLEGLRTVQLSGERWPTDLFAVPRQWDWPAIGSAAGVAVLTLLVAIRPRGTWRATMGSLWPVGGAIGLCLIASPGLFSGSGAWWTCAFEFGQLQFPEMVYGPAANLPAILQEQYGWPAPVSAVAFHVAGFDVTTKWLFNGSCAVLMVICGGAIGIHARRRDRRVLAAMVLPWLLFFMLTVSLHERYLLFAAGAAAVCAGYSVGTTLLGLLLSLASTAMTFLQMHGSNGKLEEWGQRLNEFAPTWFTPDSGRVIDRALRPIYPGLGWGLLIVLGVFLYIAWRPAGRRKSVGLANSSPDQYIVRPAIWRETDRGMPQDHATADLRPAQDALIRPVSQS